MTLRPDLLVADLDACAELLGNVHLISPAVVEAWVAAVGQQNLLNRIEREFPWATAPEIRDEPEGQAACCNIRNVAPSHQPDPHGDVVRLCEIILAFVPGAAVAVAEVVGPDGLTVGIPELPLASKRIPRTNLPPRALPIWNRRWIATASARVASPSYTDYLAQGLGLLRCLVPEPETFIDAWLRKGKVSDAACNSLNEVNAKAQNLTPPIASLHAAIGLGDKEPNNAVTPLQSILFDCSVNLVRLFSKLPDGADSYLAWTCDILARIDQAAAKEPWQLLEGRPPDEPLRLRQIVVNLRLLAGEAGARNVQPPVAWQSRAGSAKPRNALRLVAYHVKSSVERRLAGSCPREWCSSLGHRALRHWAGMVSLPRLAG